MDKLTTAAYNKLQKREHLLRVARDQMALGRITREAFRERSSQIIESYQLTDDEQRAYDRHSQVTSQRKRS